MKTYHSQKLKQINPKKNKKTKNHTVATQNTSYAVGTTPLWCSLFIWQDPEAAGDFPSRDMIKAGGIDLFPDWLWAGEMDSRFSSWPRVPTCVPSGPPPPCLYSRGQQPPKTHNNHSKGVV